MKPLFPPSPAEYSRAVDYIKSLKRKSDETESEAVVSAMQGAYHLAWMFAIFFAGVLSAPSYWLAALMFLVSLGLFWNAIKLSQLFELFEGGKLKERDVNQSEQSNPITIPKNPENQPD